MGGVIVSLTSSTRNHPLEAWIRWSNGRECFQCATASEPGLASSPETRSSSAERRVAPTTHNRSHSAKDRGSGVGEGGAT